MEIEVATENLVCTFAGEDHLDTHRLDHPGKEIHRRTGTDGRHIVGLDVIDYVADGIQTFLDGIVHLMMDGSDEIGDFAGLDEIGSPLQPYRE